MSFAQWLENNSNNRVLPAKQVVLNSEMLLGAYNDYVNGRLSKTNAPPQVIRAKQLRKYFLWDGYHRMVDILVRGVQDMNMITYQIDEGVIGSQDIRLDPKHRFNLKPGFKYGGLELLVNPDELYQLRLNVFAS